ncbi:MAG: hypothetical protein QOH73_555 [Gaiellaceae bacterium]|nr:hypothetical protein [Gaiellaceae bacterium]
MPRRIKRLRRRRLGHLLPQLPVTARAASAQEPHELDDGFVFWPESLGPRPGPALVRVGTASRALRRPSRPRGRRLVASIAFSALFFGGAAFTASAGDRVAGLLGATSASDPASALKQVQAADAAPATALRTVHPPAGPRTALAHVSVANARPDGVVASLHKVSTAAVAPVLATAAKPVAPVGITAAKGPATRHKAGAGHKHVAALTVSSPDAAPIEVAPSGTAFWSSVALPDPIPAALRLAPSFAQQLTQSATRAGVDWALALGVARAAGGRSANPVAPNELGALTTKLASLGAGLDEWAAAKSYGGSATFADRAVALARYNRAVGLAALVHGLAAQKLALATRVLSDTRVSLYTGGRDDIAQDHVDVRVLAVIEYLAEAYGRVTVSCLISGHGEFARPGVVSAHMYGRAMDIAALKGVSIYGHQQRGSITEQALKALLLLPGEVEPAQIISLIGMGGPSFALADHYDHIHIGF